MKTQSRASLFLVLLGVLAILSPVFASAGSQTSAQKPVSSASADKPADNETTAAATKDAKAVEPSDEQKLEAFCQERFARVLHESFDLRSAGNPPPETNDEAWARIGASAGRVAETIIVTLPDPIDSGFYSELDSDLDAVQIALNERYQPTRFWLAWNDTDALSKDDADRAAFCRSLVPSVMLFRMRGAGATDRRYVVALLVGESPAWGLHRRAMARALDFAASASIAAHPEATTFESRIVGPIYSGTATSLRETLSAWSESFAGAKTQTPHPAPHFVLRSGSATNPRIANALHRPNGNPSIAFSATTVPDDFLKRAFYHYLWSTDGVRLEDIPGRDHGKLLKQVAVLTESGTDYAQSYGGAKATPATKPSAPDQGAQCTCDETDYLPEFVLHFPLHISSVRSAYAETPSDESTAFPAVPRTTLTPSLEERDDARDRPPNLSPRTKFAHDLALATLLDNIVHNDIRFVGLVATDPLDVVFLAQQIRKVTPDVRLFTFDAEILYSHPSFATDLDGMLVVSPYPFFGAGGFGNRPVGVEWTPFESQAAEGIYNATRSLVSPTAPLAEYSPFPGASDCQLPIWITALGHGGVWPLTMSGYCDCHDYIRTQGGTPGADHQCTQAQTSTPSGSGAQFSTPLLWRIFRLLLGGGILAVCILYLATRRIRGTETLGGILRVELHKTWIARKTFAFDHLRRPADRQRQSIRLLVCHSVLGLFYAAITFVERLPDGNEPRPLVATIIGQAWVAGGIFLAGCLVVGVIEAVRDYRACAREGIGGGIVRTLAIDAVLPFTTLVCAVVAVCAGLHSNGTPMLASMTDRFLLYRRSTDLASGLSLILPIGFGCACLYTATLGSLRRLESYDALLVRVRGASDAEPGEPPGPISRIFSHAPKSAGGLATTEQLLLRTFGSFAAMGRTYLAAAMVFLAIPVVFLSLKPPMTLDGRVGNALFVGLFLCCLVVTCAALVRLFAFSFRLKLFLSTLARHPMAGAFARLPDALVLTAEEQISTAPPTIRDFGICARQLAALGRDAAMLPATTGEDAAGAIARIRAVTIDPSLEESLRTDLDAEAAGELRGTHGGGCLLPILVESAANVASVLEAFWSRDVAATKREREDDDEETSKASPRKPYESAIDFYQGRLDKDAIAWLRGAEEALATATALFLRHYMRPFRILTTVVLGSGLWMLLMVSTYAIDARRLSMTFIWVGVIAAASTGLWMFVQFDRDELLSRIGHTTPGEVTFDGGFARRVFTWGLLPILSVAAVHYPNVTQSAFAWLQPLLLALR